jgi:hypothetical protein
VVVLANSQAQAISFILSSMLNKMIYEAKHEWGQSLSTLEKSRNVYKEDTVSAVDN